MTFSWPCLSPPWLCRNRGEPGRSVGRVAARRLDGVEDGREVGRLGNAPQAELFGHLLGVEKGGDAHDGNLSEADVLKLSLSELPPVHPRHLQIQEHDAGL